MIGIERDARDFAIHAHESIGQKRKYTFEPYWHHPEAVAEIVRTVPHTEAMLCAAWLHDTVEDCGVSIHQIEAKFGRDVAEHVSDLTDVSRPGDGNRAARKAIDLAHSASARAQSKTIKLADMIDNSTSIVARDPDFARVYLREKAALLEVLIDGDKTLLARAMAIVDAARASGLLT